MNTKDNMISVALSRVFLNLGTSLCYSHTTKPYKPTYIKDDTEALSLDWKIVGKGIEESLDDFKRTEGKRICECSR